MIVINMYIAIILENFNQAHQEEEIGIVEEDLEMLATAIDMGIDPFPPPRKKRPWAKYAIASFMTIMILSWVSQYLMRFV